MVYEIRDDDLSEFLELMVERRRIRIPTARRHGR
jgi:hypothetical protein